MPSSYEIGETEVNVSKNHIPKKSLIDANKNLKKLTSTDLAS